MPKNTSLILVWLFCGLLGLVTFVRFFDATRMEASVDLRVSWEEAVSIASDFIRSEGFDPSDYQKAVTFNGCETIYLQNLLGVKRTNEMIRTVIPCWNWSVRYFKELKKEGFLVSIDPSSGKVNYYYHSLLEDSTGKNISQKQAQKVAERYFSKLGENLEDYRLLQDSTTKLKNRTDHMFVWSKKGFSIGDADLQIGMRINGDQLGHYSKYLRTPEQFKRDFVKTETTGFILTAISFVGLALLGLLAIFSLIVQYKHHQVKWRFALAASFLVVPVTCLDFLNTLPSIWYGYTDTLSKSLFLLLVVGGAFLSVIFGALVIFLFCAAGESLARTLKDDAFPIIHGIGNKTLTRETLLTRIIIGYSLGFIGLGYVTVFYLICMNHFDVWVPISPEYSDILTTAMPFLFPLTVAVTAAIGEEFMSRLFAISFLKKYIKIVWVSVLVPAVIWAFAHSSYQIFPMYIRGIELTIIGVIWGIIYLKYGIETTIIAHFAYNAVMVGIPLLRSNNDYFVLSGIGVVVLLALPGIFAPLWLRKKTAMPVAGHDETVDQQTKPHWPGTIIIPIAFIVFFSLPYFVTKITWDPDGDAIKPFKTYYDNGQVMSEGKYKNGKPDGPGLTYYENGQKKSEANYRDGDAIGNIMHYHENGQLESEGGYVAGAWEGHWRWFQETGELKSEGNYKNGSKHGKYKYYSKAGQLISEGEYSNDQMHGLWTWYELDGKIKNSTKYNMGVAEEELGSTELFRMPATRKSFASRRKLKQGEVVLIEVQSIQSNETLRLYKCTGEEGCNSAKIVNSWSKSDAEHNPLLKISIAETGNYYFWLQNIQEFTNSSVIAIKDFEYTDDKLQIKFVSGSSMQVYLDATDK